jgi:hypothetical protein
MALIQERSDVVDMTPEDLEHIMTMLRTRGGSRYKDLIDALDSVLETEPNQEAFLVIRCKE